MKPEIQSVINDIRGFNRFYTDILGLLNQHILDSPYALTEVRILLEIDRCTNCTANMLMENLNIDRGYMSRIIKRFEAAGIINRENSSKDRRSFVLSLTPSGKETLSMLEEKSCRQISQLISHLTIDEQRGLAGAMKYIRRELQEGISPVVIRPYKSNDIEYIIKRHRELYEAEYKFGHEFGDYVEKYVRKFDEYRDNSMESMWIAESKGKTVGVIAIVNAGDSSAQLRWFLVEPYMRGMGVGHRLVRTAIEFCKDKGYKHVFLWTVNILETARHLYSNHGFLLTETKPNDTWGENLLEERWDLFFK